MNCWYENPASSREAAAITLQEIQHHTLNFTLQLLLHRLIKQNHAQYINFYTPTKVTERFPSLGLGSETYTYKGKETSPTRIHGTCHLETVSLKL